MKAMEGSVTSQSLKKVIDVCIAEKCESNGRRPFQVL